MSLNLAFRRARSVSAVLVLLFTCITGLPARAVEAARKDVPNVLLILIDDLRPLLGCYGDNLAKTPNIDRLARRGVRFDSAHCTYPICGPSRASILSGRRPLTTNYYGWELVPDTPQMSGWFRQHGYWTGAYGKIYHMNRLAAPRLGEKDLNVVGTTVNPPGTWDVSDPCVTAEDPDGYGYSYSATLRDENPALARYVAARGDVSPKNLPGAWTWQEWIEMEMPDTQTSDGVVATHASAAIGEAVEAGRPFFVAAGFRRPHATLAAPKSYFDLYRDVKIPARPTEPHEHLDHIPDLALTFPKDLAYMVYSTEDIQRFESAYRSNIAFADAQVGRLLRKLDEGRLWDKTIVILTTDHGWHLGEHGGLTQKHTLFEESTHVPLIVVAPGQAANGGDTGHPVELVDLFPTLTDLCGLPTPEILDGLSLRPLLGDTKARLTRAGAVSVVRRNLAADGRPEFDSNLKVWGQGAETGAPPRTVLGISLRTGQWRYTEWDGGKMGVELYDETGDPRELNNLADHPALAAEQRELRQLLARTLTPKAPAGSRPTSGQPYEIPGLDLKLLPVKPGSFTMGNETNGKSDERPVRHVTLTRPYWLGATEVTQAQWEAVAGKNPSYFKGASRPVETVGWNEAVDFCQKLTEKERAAGRLPTGYAYVLPTEAQWEYACRAGTTGDYADELNDLGWYAGNNTGETQPVAEKHPNAWGFYDMHGNVWEWCSDLYGFYSKGDATDPAGAAASSNHVNRGGSFWDHQYICRSSYRNGLGQMFYGMNLGLRVALAPVPSTPVISLIPYAAPVMKKLLLLLSLASPLMAQPAGVPGAIARPGELIFADDFSRSELGPDWVLMIPTYVVKDGRLIGTQATGWHGCVAFIKEDIRDCVLEFRFRLRGAKGFNVVWDDRTYPGTHAGHICRVSLLPTQIRLADDKEGSMRNELFAMRQDPRHRAEAVALAAGHEAAAPIRLEQDRWYQLKVEMLGDKMRATLDGGPVCYLQSSGIDHQKHQFYFTILENSVEFDDLKIWQALPAGPH